MSEEIYHQYESGAVDLPFTFLHKCAKVFGIEITVLPEGHSAKLSGYTVTRRGKGLVTASEDGITIQDMAPMFRKKLATPYWVTYKYSEELQNKPIHTSRTLKTPPVKAPITSSLWASSGATGSCWC